MNMNRRLKYFPVLCYPFFYRYFHSNGSTHREKKIHSNLNPHNLALSFFLRKFEKIYVTLTYENLHLLDNVMEILRDKLNPKWDYYVLIKVRYKSSKYLMAGNQFILRYTQQDYDLKIFHNVVMLRLLALHYTYGILQDEVVWIQLIFTPFNTEFLSDLRVSEEVNFNELDISTRKNMNFFPITTDPILFNNPLKVVIKDNRIIDKLNGTNLLRLIQKTNPSIDIPFLELPETKFYLRDVVSPPYVLAISEWDEYILKHAYSLSGVYISGVKDIFNDKGFKRINDNKTTTYIDENNMILYKSK